MKPFPNAFEAFEWASTVLEAFRNGKAFDPNPELFRGGTSTMGAIHAAMVIEEYASRSCLYGMPCPQHDQKCFLNWYLPEIGTDNRRSQHQADRINSCVRTFERLLRDDGIIE